MPGKLPWVLKGNILHLLQPINHITLKTAHFEWGPKLGRGLQHDYAEVQVALLLESNGMDKN